MTFGPAADNGVERLRQARIAPLTHFEAFACVELPILAAAAQVSLMRYDTVGPWMIWSYAGFGGLVSSIASRVKVGGAPFGLVCGVSIAAAALAVLAALDHFLNSYFFAWPAALAPLMATPCLSAFVYGRRAWRMLRQDAQFPLSALALGALIVLVAPIALQCAERQWVDGELAAFSASDAQAAAAVRAIDRYPLRFGRFTYDVCSVSCSADPFRTPPSSRARSPPFSDPIPTNAKRETRTTEPKPAPGATAFGCLRQVRPSLARPAPASTSTAASASRRRSVPSTTPRRQTAPPRRSTAATSSTPPRSASAGLRPPTA